MGPGNAILCRGPRTLSSIGAVASARSKPAHDGRGYLSDTPETGFLPGAGLLLNVHPRRNSTALRGRPFLSAENTDHLRVHSLLLSSLVVADWKMTRGSLNGTQKAFE